MTGYAEGGGRSERLEFGSHSSENHLPCKKREVTVCFTVMDRCRGFVQCGWYRGRGAEVARENGIESWKQKKGK